MDTQARTASVLFASLLWLLFPGGSAGAAPEQALDRAQALRSLSDADAPLRRQAAGRLGEVGVFTDTPELLRALRDADAETRANAEQAIWQIWGRSDDAQIDALYRKGVEQMSAGELQPGIATFTRIVRLKPEFAEGWNKRATLYFMTGEYRKSLADCAQVIKRNPYHFGALAGYGQIYLRLKDYTRSLEYFRRALELNPNMDGVRLSILLLEQLIEQRRKDMI
ncbi:MAG: tetratricopeptide repeat protein [Burkholderiales bacterium]|nr:tetratricopeptide repeat protein [Burkholderiales bacterium]